MAKNKNLKRALAKQLDGEEFQVFLDEMRAFESGLDPSLVEDYEAGYNDPNALNYIDITERNPDDPDDTVRAPKVDGEGNTVRRDMSYKEYFQILGVDDIWMGAGADPTPDTVRQMQFKSTNPWNFVGYQLGEGVMSDSGIYNIPTELWLDGKYYPKYYIFQYEHTWMDDEWEFLVSAPWDSTKKIIATRSNFWEGSFTGRNGINNLDDLKDETKHEMAMRDAIWHNIDYILAGLERENTSLEEALAKSWDDNGTPVESSMSGIIASAHLSGAEATLQLLANDTIPPGDETGTGILTYMRMFGQALTIVDEPGDTTLSGTGVPERISCGVSDSADIVRTGGSGNNSILVDCLKESSASTPTKIEVDDANIDVENQSNDIFYMTNPLSPITGGLRFTFDPLGLPEVTVSDVSGDNGDLKRISFIGKTQAELRPVIEQIIVPSRVFDMHYNETDHPSQIIPDFRDPGDFIRSTLSMTFKDMMFDRIDPAGVKVRSVGGDGGSYFFNQLIGYTAEELRAGLFVGFGGSLLDVKSGFSVNINDFNNDPFTPIVLQDWQKTEDVLLISGYITGFIDSRYEESAGDVVFVPNYNSGLTEQYRIILANVTWAELLDRDTNSAPGLKPIQGLTGSLSDASPLPPASTA